MKNIQKYFDIAKNEAMSIDRSHRHVSIVVRKGEILAIGVNCRKTHPMASTYGYFYEERHSELDAIAKVPKKLRNNLVLLNFRFNRWGELRKSKPCYRCMPWVIELFDKVFYTTEEGIVSHRTEKYVWKI